MLGVGGSSAMCEVTSDDLVESKMRPLYCRYLGAKRNLRGISVHSNSFKWRPIIKIHGSELRGQEKTASVMTTISIFAHT